MKLRENGFSLVEVLVSILLLTFGFIAVAPMFVYAKKGTKASGDMGQVGSIAVRRMELLRGSRFNTLTAGGSLTSNVTGYYDTSNPQYSVRWTIADNTGATVKTTSVKVTDARTIVGAAKSVTLVTLRANE